MKESFKQDLKTTWTKLNNLNSIIDNKDYRFSTERGTSKGDVVVNNVVGIELKKDFTNSQKRKLRGQLEDYADNYNYVTACSCGIEDTDGWYEVKEKMIDSRSFGYQTTFNEIKDSKNFGDNTFSSGVSGNIC